jgi:hypothetical protein
MERRPTDPTLGEVLGKFNEQSTSWTPTLYGSWTPRPFTRVTVHQPFADSAATWRISRPGRSRLAGAHALYTNPPSPALPARSRAALDAGRSTTHLVSMSQLVTPK